jgi:hypothetical protein
MRILTLVSTGVLALAVVPGIAQPRPDLTGTWTATKDAPTGLAAAPSPVFGDRFAVRQGGDNLSVVRPVRDMTVVTPYVLDGREVRTRIPGGLCQGDSETIEAGTRDGDAIVLTMTGSTPSGGGAVMKRDIRRVFRLQSPDTLVVEGRMAIQGVLRPVATIYRRSNEPIPGADAPVAAPKSPATIAQAAWISGVWVSAAGTTGQATVEERWTPAAGGSMIGVSRTLRGTSMPAFEFLCIVERGGTLIYSAMPNGRTPPTHFTLTAVTADSATFENPAHDFPKMIRYTKRPDGSLETTIAGEGGQRAQSVILKRQD